MMTSTKDKYRELGLKVDRAAAPDPPAPAPSPAPAPPEENTVFDADANSAKELPQEEKAEKSELDALREERDALNQKIAAIQQEIKDAENGIITARDRFDFLQGTRRSCLGKISTLEMQLSNTNHRIAMREREKANA